MGRYDIPKPDWPILGEDTVKTLDRIARLKCIRGETLDVVSTVRRSLYGEFISIIDIDGLGNLEGHSNFGLDPDQPDMPAPNVRGTRIEKYLHPLCERFVMERERE